MLDIGGLDEGFPVIGEMPKCSDTLMCKWRVVGPTYDANSIDT